MKRCLDLGFFFSLFSLIFGSITCVTGVLGVASGVLVSRHLRKVTPRADPLVCAAGLLMSAPFLYLAIVFAETSIVATYVSSQCPPVSVSPLHVSHICLPHL